MKKHMRTTFLPSNYQQLMFQRLQNLQQGSKSVDEYTTEFYQLVSRNEIQDSEEHLVVRYVGGLRLALQDMVSMFDPMTVAIAHQRALRVETELSGRAARPIGVGRSTSNNNVPFVNHNSGGKVLGGTTTATAGGIRCFNCGEIGHRRSECRKPGKRALLIETDDMDEGRITSAYEEELELEGEGRDEEVVSGDVGIALVVRRACITPRVTDDRWLRCNIFQSTCTIKNKLCKFLIDAGSCENIISTEAVSKLGLVTEQHPRPYRLAWLKKGGEISVSKRSLVTFSVGMKYQDIVWCDVVTMEACHLLLGRPWQFDRDVTHNGFSKQLQLLA